MSSISADAPPPPPPTDGYGVGEASGEPRSGRKETWESLESWTISFKRNKTMNVEILA